MTHCAWCGEELTPDEAAYPELRDGDNVCEQCLCDEEHFTCCWCGNCGEEEEQRRFLVVFDPTELGVALPGLYRVERLPYYLAPLIGHGWLIASALTWLGALPDCHDPGDYPCGHLCAPCQQRALAALTYRRRCMAAALAPSL
jgi:hypothetical protein